MFLQPMHSECICSPSVILPMSKGWERDMELESVNQKNRDYFLQHALKEYYDYSRFSTCIENSWYFWETIATERLEKVLLFLRKYHDSKAVALKEYYNYSPISTYTENCWYFLETIVTVKLLIYRKQERDWGCRRSWKFW